MPSSVAAMKRAATGLLVFAGLVFVVAKLNEDGREWAGYVRATAEAAMVGALADWFAVTALFKHPLGLRIPHTAIISKRKNEIGQSLGEFVRDHFLTKENLTRLITEEHMSQRIGGQLANRSTAEAVTEQVSAVIRGVTEVLNDDTVQDGLENVVFTRVRAVPVAPIAGRAIDWGLEGRHHEVLIDSTLKGMGAFLNENKETFRDRLRTESPWWVPEPVDERVFEKIYDAVNRFISEVGGNRNHELRRALDLRTLDLAERLKTSPELVARGEELKEEILANDEVRHWVGGLWERIKDGVIEASHDPESELRQQVTTAIMETGERLQTDLELQATVDKFLIEGAGYIAEHGGDPVVNVISTTVERWDARETVLLIEDKVGRDLQFIRINGTIVGGLAGLILHTISQVLL
ncbi:MAG: DUF445 domain-containing protein [Acidimicrobiales bacterium]|nr:DUF445 domain-containing protein [Acidimicrobiales bacterium]